MRFRPATEADRPAIEAFLGARIETSMFPLGNLARHGMAGGHPRAMAFAIAGDPLEDLVGISDEGMAMPQLDPGRAPEAARALAGRRVAGILGATPQVRALRSALGLGAAPAEIDADEPLLALDLAALRMPAVTGPTKGSLTIEPWSEARRDLLLGWREAYGREVLGWTGNARARAERDLASALATGQQRVLLRDGEPVAATGFNARLPGIVQVGGVWTPPQLRGQGLARAAVAFHLAEARAEGAARAVLFSSSEAAVRAYRALGFAEVGRFTLLMFREPQEAALTAPGATDA